MYYVWYVIRSAVRERGREGEKILVNDESTVSFSFFFSFKRGFAKRLK